MIKIMFHVIKVMFDVMKIMIDVDEGYIFNGVVKIP